MMWNRFAKILLMMTLVFVQSVYAKKIELNFKNLTVDEFIKLIAKITHKNILLTKKIGGKIDFVAVHPVDEKELYGILLNVLKSRGYTLVEDESGFLKLVMLTRIYSEGKVDGFSGTVTRIVHLQCIAPTDAIAKISIFKSTIGKIIPDVKKNVLVITDFNANVEKMNAILKKIDRCQNREIEILRLKYTDAKEIIPQAKKILDRLLLPNSYELIDTGTERSIVAVALKKYINKIKKVVAKLDMAKKEPHKQSQIIQIKNSDAKKIYEVVQKILQQKYKNTKKVPALALYEDTNSIIVTGSLEEIQNVANIVKELDIPKKQVYVKVRILEISETKAREIGNKLGIIGGSASESGLYTLSAKLGGVPLAFDPKSLGLSIPTIKNGLALGATLDLLEIMGAAKKLSEPSILTLNNTPSNIYVGKTISVITQSTVGTSTTDLTRNTFTRQDIGLKLTIKPRIDSDRKVAINVKGVIEDLLPGSQVGLPTTSKREIDTTAIVKNGETIVVGGLVRNNSDNTTQKVPLLGDIPIFGTLFRYTKKNMDKTTIVIVVTPFIVEKSEDLYKLKKFLVEFNEMKKQFVKKVIQDVKKN